MTPVTGLKKLLAANAAGAFVAQVAQTADPAAATGVGLVTLGAGASPAAGLTLDNLLLVPYGAGSAGQTFDLRVWGWRKTTTGLWVPILLCQATCTLCTAAGVAGQDVAAAELFCDTLALVKGNANVSVELVSPTGNVPAHLVCDARGCDRLTVTFSLGTASGANALAGGV